MAGSDLQDALESLQHRDVDAAVATLEQTADTLRGSPAVHVLLARAYEAQERWAEALSQWAQAQLLLPNSPVARDGKRRVLRKMETTSAPSDAPPLAETLDEAAWDLDDSASDSSEAPPANDDPEAEPPSETDPPPGLDELRRRAEEEAQRGGARSGLAGPPGLSVESEGGNTPEERVEELEASESDDDLDRLIDELESARVEPDPEAEAPAPDLADDSADDLVSETLARIYEQQEQYAEAARVYEKLADQTPGRADDFRQKARQMREEADPEASPSGEDG